MIIKITDNGYPSYNYRDKHYRDEADADPEMGYDANGNMVYDLDRGISTIRYNNLNLPDTIQFKNGSQIVHRYNVLGRRLATTYYTRKVATAVPVGTTLAPSDNLSDYNVLNYAYNDNMVYIDYNNRGVWQLEYVHTPVGYVRYYGPEEHYPFYYIRDYLGNVREVWVHPWLNHSECVQRTQYYPSGLPWNEGYTPSEQPYKYGGKEFVEMHGLDEYDSQARWYYPAIMRTTTMDPLCEKYPDISPYAWCGNNPIRNVDPTGREWTNISGDTITDQSNIKAYIFYNKEEFGTQTMKMYSDLENKYGEGSVALSDVLTKEEFQHDWQSMSSLDIQEININHHGSNQAIHLDWRNKEYITSTGTGKIQSGIDNVTNVSDLGVPIGDITCASLHLNTCHSNSKGNWLGNIRIRGNRIPGTSATLVGTKETLMQSFRNNFNFYMIRGTSAGVSYNRKTLQPEPQFFWQKWDYMFRNQ